MTDNKKIVICVSGGNVNGIFTNDPETKVYLVDYDNLEADPSDDCNLVVATSKIGDFQSIATKEIESFPGIKKLLVQLAE